MKISEETGVSSLNAKVKFLKTIVTPIIKAKEYNELLCLVLVKYQKAFSAVEYAKAFNSMVVVSD